MSISRASPRLLSPRAPVRKSTCDQLLDYNLLLSTNAPGSRSASVCELSEDDMQEAQGNVAAHDTIYNVNHNIKSTLTDLLNFAVVRKDDKMRLEIQSRLMEAERELKRQRRRKVGVSACVVSGEGDGAL